MSRHQLLPRPPSMQVWLVLLPARPYGRFPWDLSGGQLDPLRVLLRVTQSEHLLQVLQAALPVRQIE